MGNVLTLTLETTACMDISEMPAPVSSTTDARRGISTQPCRAAAGCSIESTGSRTSIYHNLIRRKDAGGPPSYRRSTFFALTYRNFRKIFWNVIQNDWKDRSAAVLSKPYSELGGTLQLSWDGNPQSRQDPEPQFLLVDKFSSGGEFFACSQDAFCKLRRTNNLYA